MHEDQPEFGWLIEFPGTPPSWWDGRGPETATADANDAVRFARREDAEAVVAGIIKRIVLVVEHSWSDMPVGEAL